jgi:hypothetical protein
MSIKNKRVFKLKKVERGAEQKKRTLLVNVLLVKNLKSVSICNLLRSFGNMLFVLIVV